ncbi:MAG: hypothetical protein E4H37_08200 [Gemmatimonadales bacterium]|nr:MAG: hypothetical protein E4H37_08200 [Gemmatimonadales bacterium]
MSTRMGKWWIHVILVGLGLIGAISVGALFQTATGPGSDALLFVMIGAYSVCLLAFRAKVVRSCGVVLLVISVLGFVVNLREKRRFLKEMHHRYPAAEDKSTVGGGL